MQSDFVLEPSPGEVCEVDGQLVIMQIFKGTGVCCEICRKVRAGEITKEEAADRVSNLQGH